MKATSMDEKAEEKGRENQELIKICDDLIANVGK